MTATLAPRFPGEAIRQHHRPGGRPGDGKRHPGGGREAGGVAAEALPPQRPLSWDPGLEPMVLRRVTA